MHIELAGYGHAVGSQVASNTELATRLGLAEDWFVRRTGIVERRVCSAEENVLTLAKEAVQAACKQAGITPAEIGHETMILHIQNGLTCLTPPSGIVLAAELGIDHSRVVAIDGVCAEPIPALEYASLMLDAGRCERVILSAAADFLPIVRPNDTGTVALFGAGAGALVLNRTTPTGASTLGGLKWETRASHSALGQIPVTGYNVTDDGISIDAGYYEMDGTGLARVALAVLPDIVDDVLAQAGWTKADVDLVIAHQPNAKLLGIGIRRLGFDKNIVPTPVVHHGNMGPASLLVNLSMAHQAHQLAPGTKVLLLAFGLGFSCGAAALEI